MAREPGSPPPRTGIRSRLRTLLQPPHTPPSTQCDISRYLQEFYWCRCYCQLCYQKLNSATLEGQLAVVSLSLAKMDSTCHFFLTLGLFSKDASQGYLAGEWGELESHTCAPQQGGLGKYNFWLLTCSLTKGRAFTKGWAPDKCPLYLLQMAKSWWGRRQCRFN